MVNHFTLKHHLTIAHVDPASNPKTTKYQSGIQETRKVPENTFGIYDLDLYILAGFSGSGKSTLLETANLDIDKIYSPLSTKLKILPKEIRDCRTHRSERENCPELAMIHGGYFGLEDITFLTRQKILPKKVLMHLDLTDLFLSPQLHKYTENNCMQLAETDSKKKLDKHISKFFKIPFFQKFKTISIATINIDFHELKRRYFLRLNQTNKNFYFTSGMEATCQRMLRAWHDQISLLPISINNSITEKTVLLH